MYCNTCNQEHNTDSHLDEITTYISKYKQLLNSSDIPLTAHSLEALTIFTAASVVQLTSDPLIKLMFSALYAHALQLSRDGKVLNNARIEYEETKLDPSKVN